MIYHRSIKIYAWKNDLTYPLLKKVKLGSFQRSFTPEMDFGMKLIRKSGRWNMRWQEEDLRLFALEYLLPHEVGHHIYQMRYNPLQRQFHDKVKSEKFACEYSSFHAKEYLRTRRIN